MQWELSDSLLEFIPQLRRGDGFYAMNGILSTFVLDLWLCLGGLTIKRKEKNINGILILIAPIVVPILLDHFSFYSNRFFFKNLRKYFILHSYMVYSVYTIVEGGIYIIVSGLILYIFNKK